MPVLKTVAVVLPDGTTIKKRGKRPPSHALIARQFETAPVWERRVMQTFLGDQEVKVMVGERRLGKAGAWSIVSWHTSEDAAHGALGPVERESSKYEGARVVRAFREAK